MKPIILFLLLVALPFAASADEQVAAIKRDAQKCVDAFMAGDYASMSAYVPSRVVKMTGDKDGFVKLLKDTLAQMRTQGIEITSASVGEPAATKKIGIFLTTVVPEKIVLKAPGGELTQEESMLGVSEDEGKHWTFVDLGPLSQEALDDLFPEFEGKFILPEKHQPVFHADKDAKQPDKPTPVPPASGQ